MSNRELENMKTQIETLSRSFWWVVVWLLLPLLACSCMSKDRALRATTKFPPYSALASIPKRTNIIDFDGKKTDYHYVERKASTNSPTLVFVHGYPDSLFTWTKLLVPDTNASVHQLTNSFNLLAMDLPGQGFTKDSRWFSRRRAILEPNGAGRSLVAFLDAKPVEGRVVLVAHSWGALVALHAARWAADPVSKKSGRKWQIAGIMLISPEGTPRPGPEHLPSERELRDGFFGLFSVFHWLAGTWNWLSNPDAHKCHNRWTGAVEDALQQMSTDNPKPCCLPRHQVESYALLMRVRQNYRTNRYLVRRDKSCDWPILVWAGTSFPGKRLVIWGGKDNLFPVPLHSTFVTNFFRPCVEFKLIPNAGHLVPDEAPEQIAQLLIDQFGPNPKPCP